MRTKMIKNLIGFSLIIGGVFVLVGCGEQAKVEVPEVTPVAEMTPVSVTPIPTPTPQTTTTTGVAELKNQVYTNNDFGYQITLPTGYKAEVTKTRADRAAGGDRDKVIITDDSENILATIVTPPPEVGWELWDWDGGKESTVKTNDSSKDLYRHQASPLADYDIEESIVTISWGNKFLSEVEGNDMRDDSGIMFVKYEAGQDNKVAEFNSLVKSFKFL